MKLFREKKNQNTPIKEYIYESSEQRAEHIELMATKGYVLDSQQARIVKKGVFLFEATSKDFEPYARFRQDSVK